MSYALAAFLWAGSAFSDVAQAASGDPVPSFGERGVVRADYLPDVGEVLADVDAQYGSLPVAVGHTDPVDGVSPEVGIVARHLWDGSPDPSFGGGDGFAAFPGARWHHVAQLPAGEIVAAGSLDGDLAVAKYTEEGLPDSTFGGGDGLFTVDITGDDHPASAFGLLVDEDGRLVVGGEAHGCLWPYFPEGPAHECIARAARLFALTAAGALDRDYGGNGSIALGDVGIPGGLGGNARTFEGLAVAGSDPCEGLVVRRFGPDGDPLARGALRIGPQQAGCRTPRLVEAVAFNGGVVTVLTHDRIAAFEADGQSRTLFNGRKVARLDLGYSEPMYDVAAADLEPEGLAFAGLTESSPRARAVVGQLSPGGRYWAGFGGGGVSAVDVPAGTESFTALDRTSAGLLAVGVSDGDTAPRTPILALLDGSLGSVASCMGRQATLEGTAGADILRARRGTVVAGPGDDRIFVDRGRRVTVCGDSGDDIVYGGGTVWGGAGDDFIHTGGGALRAYGGKGDDRVKGFSGADRLYGGPGADLVKGEWGEDRLAGGEGRDRILGGDGADLLSGGPGRDELRGEDSPDTLIGGPALDRLLGGPVTPVPGRSFRHSGPDLSVSGRIRDGVVTALKVWARLRCDGGGGRSVISVADIPIRQGRFRYRDELNYDDGEVQWGGPRALEAEVGDAEFAPEGWDLVSGTFMARFRTHDGLSCGTETIEGEPLRFDAFLRTAPQQSVQQ